MMPSDGVALAVTPPVQITQSNQVFVPMLPAFQLVMIADPTVGLPDPLKADRDAAAAGQLNPGQ
jgi:hypothetical protein